MARVPNAAVASPHKRADAASASAWRVTIQRTPPWRASSATPMAYSRRLHRASSTIDRVEAADADDRHAAKHGEREHHEAMTRHAVRQRLFC